VSTPSSSTVAKAFRVLELFRHHRYITVRICQEALGLPRATAHRLLVSLREVGAVENTGDGHYRLSIALFELGALAPLRRSLGDRAGNEIESLADNTGCRVHLAILREHNVLFIEAAHGRQARAQGYRTRVGYRGPLHATAIGKVLLAYAPSEVQRRELAQPLAPFTHRTVCDPAILAEQLREIRITGHTFTVGEYVLGVSSLAVPLADGEGQVRAAISVVGPGHYMERRRHQLLSEAQVAARRITRGDGATLRQRTVGDDALVVSR